jgi:hypothetical protein
MDEDLSQLNLLIQSEADDILYHKGLLEVLRKYGKPHISGSYVLDLMTWRDLDLYLEADHIPEAKFFELGKELVDLLTPVKMSYRNERQGKNEALPIGLYWGIYLGNEREGAWKIDIWAVNSKELQDRLTYCDILKRKLTSVTRRKILQIKSQCWKDPEYRRSFLSIDIYQAVLNHGVSTLYEFKEYLKANVFK